jgi:hypothetical protein
MVQHFFIFFCCQGPLQTAKRIPFASVAQLVEHHLAKVAVESSNLFARSISPCENRGLFLCTGYYISGRSPFFLDMSERGMLNVDRSTGSSG